MDIFNQIARDLPEGYEISISIERNAGWAVLLDASGGLVDEGEAEDELLLWLVNEARNQEGMEPVDLEDAT